MCERCSPSQQPSDADGRDVPGQDGVGQLRAVRQQLSPLVLAHMGSSPITTTLDRCGLYVNSNGGWHNYPKNTVSATQCYSPTSPIDDISGQIRQSAQIIAPGMTCITMQRFRLRNLQIGN